MKHRTDYVSNSSSSSFIIRFYDRDGGQRIDKRLVTLLGLTEKLYISGECGTKDECDELTERAARAFGAKSLSNWYDNELCVGIWIDSSTLRHDDAEQLGVIRDILNLNEGEIRCDCGEHWGWEGMKPVQIATAIECMYGNLSISGDDHLSYVSIRGTDLDPNVYGTAEHVTEMASNPVHEK